MTSWRGGVADREADGTKGGAAGAGKGGAVVADLGGAPAGLNGGSGGGGVNSSSPEDGDGGVAVAAAVVRSTDSGLERGAAGPSAVRAGGGAAGPDGECGPDPPKIPASQPLGAAGVERGPPCEDSPGEAGVRWLPDGGVFWPVGAGMEITPLQTEQRARTPVGGTLAGSTLKIERQSGQLTFIRSLRSYARHVWRAAAPAALPARRCVYQQYKPSQEGSWRTFSSLSQVGLPDGPRSMCGEGW